MAPADRWALAGRSLDRLRAVRERLAAQRPQLSELTLLQADAEDPASLARVAAGARVVVSTVGPYLRHGEGLVAACADAGSDYVDLCGEPEFVDLMYLRHHGRAQRTGARLVHSCGFDSIPYDLGVQLCVDHLPEGVPLTVESFVRVGATFSGGTFHSAIGVLARLAPARRVAAQRRRAEGPPAAGRHVHGIMRPPHRDPFAGGWVVPAPTIDPITVLRSARALARYGPDFHYGHYLATRRATTTIGLIAGTGTLAALAPIPPVRDLLLRVRGSGEGPDPQRRARSWFQVRIAGRVGDGEGEPDVVCEVSGGDPGYGETAKMLAESALCLADDPLPQTSGQVTPAVAMGPALTARLRAAGIGFEVVSA